MMNLYDKRHYFIVLFLLPFLFISQQLKAETISITDANNVEIAKIEKNDTITIYIGESLISSKIGSSGKRKYLVNQTIIKIKRKDNGFKLKTESGDVLWKIKNKEGKLKIANNDEMENAFKIKQKSKVKIYRNDNKVGSAVLKDNLVKINTTQGNELNVSNVKALFAAVLGLEEIPLEQRLIILIELASP